MNINQIYPRTNNGLVHINKDGPNNLRIGMVKSHRYILIRGTNLTI
jgi:hypothetical protein